MTSSNVSPSDRIICLIDMDCFYVQVEEVEAPQYHGLPCGVSQYNPYRGGGLIAVNYQAREFNVKRGMRGEQAKELCPNFHTFYVKQNRGKADLTKYREASYKIFDIITKHCPNVEKASIDEAYVDLTDLVQERQRVMTQLTHSDLSDSYIAGSYSLDKTADNQRVNNLKAWLDPIGDIQSSTSSDAWLAIGGLIVQEIRYDIFKTLGYHCSAGVGHNKTLAKLCCGINKPNKQTILPLSSHEELMAKTPIQKIKNLGGKLGVILTEQMKLKTMGDLARISAQELIKQFGEKTGFVINWLNQISNGIDLEPVLSRQQAKSIGCSKRFPGKSCLSTFAKVSYWVSNLTEELEERLASDKLRNKREAQSLVIHIENEAGSFSKTMQITKNCKIHFAELSIEALKAFNKSPKPDYWKPGITCLGISASKFIDENQPKKSNPLMKYFTNNVPKKQETLNDQKIEKEASANTSGELSNEIHKISDEVTSVFQTSEDQPTTSKQSETSKPNDSGLDAENLSFADDPNEIVLIDDESSKCSNSSSKKTPAVTSFFEKSNEQRRDSIDTQTNDDIDYVQCEKCRKKILAWEFPEHEDFHFAQELSRQICESAPAARPVLTTNNETNKKKRAMVDTPTKNDQEPKKTIIKAKKMKTEATTSKKQQKTDNIKPIHNYFKKKSD